MKARWRSHHGDRTSGQVVLAEGPGRFDGFEGYRDRDRTVLDVLHDRLDALGVPILAGLPLGHGPNPRTVPLGTTCTLDADAGTLTCSSALH